MIERQPRHPCAAVLSRQQPRQGHIYGASPARWTRWRRFASYRGNPPYKEWPRHQRRNWSRAPVGNLTAAASPHPPRPPHRTPPGRPRTANQALDA